MQQKNTDLKINDTEDHSEKNEIFWHQNAIRLQKEQEAVAINHPW